MKTVFILAALFLLTAAALAADKAPQTVNKAHLDAGLNCEACHGTAKPDKRAPAAPCIECHTNKSADAPIELKDDLGKSYSVSPHASHAGQMRCTLCHSSHTNSVLYCNEGCHHKFTIKVP